MVDGLGNPIHFILTGSQVHDCKATIPLFSKLEIRESNILADRTCGTKEIRDFITQHDTNYTILPKSSNPNPWYCGFWLYKERHLVECFFNKIKAFRRIATRYDKLATSFIAFVYVAYIWLLSK